MKKRNFLLLILCLCVLSTNTIVNCNNDYVVTPCDHIIQTPIKQ